MLKPENVRFIVGKIDLHQGMILNIIEAGDIRQALKEDNMKAFSPRVLEIIRILNKNTVFTSAEKISAQLGISQKTVLRTLNSYADDPQCRANGFSILSRRGKGYCLQIEDSASFGNFASKYLASGSADSYKAEREKEILQYLLLNDDKYVTIQQIADQVFVSETTISLDLKDIRHSLKRFGLEIINKPAKGIRIKGNEMNKRLCCSKYFFAGQTAVSKEIIRHFSFSEEDTEIIQSVVLNTLSTYQIQMSDISRKHLVRHILISLYRMNEKQFITFEKEEIEQIENTREFKIAQSMVLELQAHFDISDAEEVFYISIQLLSKKTLTGKSQYHLAEDIEDILNEIFLEIKSKLDIDLQSDAEVFNYLAMHFEPMFTRLKYGIKSNNPLAEDIKVQQPMPFEMGLIAKKVILDHYDYVLDDSEVGYLALYFSLALDRLKYLKKPKNILVVCGLGVCGSRILVYKLRQQYGDYISDILSCQIHELRNISLNQFDCIISTVNEPILASTPVIYIEEFIADLKNEELDDFFLNEHRRNFKPEDYLKKEAFLTADTMNSEEEAISYILENIGQVCDVPEELKKNILEREHLSSTAFGNYCALPHPIKMCSEETIFAVLLLKKSMLWNKKKVKCIFLLSPSKKRPSDLRFFTDALAQFISDPNLFSIFTKEPCYETLKDALGRI